MKLVDIYNLGIQLGMEADPREQEEISQKLKAVQNHFAELKDQEKTGFDEESFHNPYSDTRVLWGDSGQEIKTIMTGIDIDVGEILLADRLREKGKHIDLVIAHHPHGKAKARLYDMMHIHEDTFFQAGVPINIAEGIFVDRISEVERAVLPMNHNKVIDAAKLLEIPFMCIHTPADNIVYQFLRNLFQEKNPQILRDVVMILKEIKEYDEAGKTINIPKIVSGAPERRVGKIYIDMTGGTSGSEGVIAELAQAGVGTIICMHIKEEHLQEAKKHHLNIVIAGHIASDSLGMNLFLDELEKKGIEIIPCGGLIRVRRF